MDKCEEMRARFDRFYDGQLVDSGTMQIQAISNLQMKNIRKYFLEKPGRFRYCDVAKTEIILPKPKDNESTLQIKFKDGRWVRLIGYSLYKTAAKRLLDGLCEIAARYPDEDDDEDE